MVSVIEGSRGLANLGCLTFLCLAIVALFTPTRGETGRTTRAEQSSPRVIEGRCGQGRVHTLLYSQP